MRSIDKLSGWISTRGIILEAENQARDKQIVPLPEQTK